MDLKYTVEFPPNGKIIRFPKSAVGIGLFGFLALISLAQAVFGIVTGMWLFTLVGGGIFFVFAYLLWKLNLTKNEIHLSQERIVLYRGKAGEGIDLPLDQVRFIGKKSERRKVGKLTHEFYTLYLGLADDRTVPVINPSTDVRRVDEVRTIITKYTGLPYVPLNARPK